MIYNFNKPYKDYLKEQANAPLKESKSPLELDAAYS